jgi:outer membrane protein TolC
MSFPFFTRRGACHTAQRRGVTAALAFSLLGAFCIADCVAAGPALSLPQAQGLARERSRRLAASDFAVAASRDMAVAAGQLPDPVLKVGVDNLPVSGVDRFSVTNDFMTMRRIGVMQELTGADKRQFRSALYERAAEKALAEKEVNVASIDRDTALAFLDLYYALAMESVVAEQGTQAKLEMQAAESTYRAGRGSQAEVVAARSALAMFDDRASELRGRVLNARTALARWIGQPAQLELAGLPDVNVIRLDAADLDQTLAHHPEIAVLNRQVDVALTEAQIADANRDPDWSVELAWQQRGPAYSNMVSVGVSIPFQWDRKNRQDRELSSKLATVEQSKAERDEMLRQHVAETRAMLIAWQNGQERVSRFDREILPLANQKTAATLAAYRGGKAGLMDVLGARRGEIEARIQALQLQADTARLWAKLNFLFPAQNTSRESREGAHGEPK